MFDKTLKIAAVMISIIPSSTFATSITYTYDSMDRLSSVMRGDETEIKYTHDKAGNRLSRVIVARGDTDNDGLKDAWEQQYFGNLSQGGNDDTDHDGWTNSQEQAGETNPTDKASPGWWCPCCELKCK